jgi:hypothetical protein
VIGYRILISTESLDIDTRGVAGHRRELLSRDEPTPTPQWDQLTDPVTITGDCERLPMLDRIHDLLGPVAQVALGDLGLWRHDTIIRIGATWCYRVSKPGQASNRARHQHVPDPEV